MDWLMGVFWESGGMKSHLLVYIRDQRLIIGMKRWLVLTPGSCDDVDGQ